MSSSISIKVNAAGRGLQELSVPEGAGRSGRTVRLKVPPHARVEMLDPLTGLGPQQIQVKRVGESLHVAFKGSELAAPDLVLEDFFKGRDEDRSRLLGKISGHDTQDYVPADSSTGELSQLADGQAGSTYTLQDAAHAVVAGGPAGAVAAGESAGAAGAGGLGTLGTIGVAAGVLVVAGVAAGGGGGGGGDATPAPSADTQAPAAPSDVRVLAQADGRILVSGLAEAGSTVIVRFPDGSEKAGAAQADGRFEVGSDAVQSSGTVSAQARDAAGNTGPAVTSPYADLTPPVADAAITGVVDDFGAQTGTLASGSQTNDRTPLLQGSLGTTLEAGAVLTVLRDGQAVGQAQVSGTQWSYQDAVRADGPVSYTVQAVDAAGNKGPVSGAFALTFDATAPGGAVSILAATDDVLPVSATLQARATTNDASPLILGALSGVPAPGESVQVTREGLTQPLSATLNLNTAGVPAAWSLQDGGLQDGVTYHYRARLVDAAGNLGPESAPFTLSVDLSAPRAGVQIDEVFDAPNDKLFVPTMQLSLTGTLGSGESIEILRHVTGSQAPSTSIGTASPLGEQVWTFTDVDYSQLDVASVEYVARVVDAAGNVGNASSAVTWPPPDASAPFDLAGAAEEGVLVWMAGAEPVVVASDAHLAVPRAQGVAGAGAEIAAGPFITQDLMTAPGPMDGYS